MRDGACCAGENIATKSTDIIICITVFWELFVFVFPYFSLGNSCKVKGVYHHIYIVITLSVHHAVTAGRGKMSQVEEFYYSTDCFSWCLDKKIEKDTRYITSKSLGTSWQNTHSWGWRQNSILIFTLQLCRENMHHPSVFFQSKYRLNADFPSDTVDVLRSWQMFLFFYFTA